MKQTIYTILMLCLFSIFSTNLGAQGSTCERNFVIKTTPTASTCMANGEIKVTLEGSLSDIEVDMTEYALRPITGTEGTSLQFTKNNVLKGVSAGTYIVSVRTFCIENSTVGVVTESTNVVVGGTYKPLMVEFDLARMRKSYSNCATGQISFSIKSGTGSGNFTYFITKAPAGVALGEIFPIAASPASGYLPYSVPGLYPSGAYQIDVYDNCSKATMSFTLDQTTDFPTPKVGSSYFYPLNIGTSCSDVRWSPSSPDISEADHYYKHYVAGLYEIALVETGQTPAASDWSVWTNSYKYVTLPNNYKNYFTGGKLTAHVRLKDCNEYGKSVTTNLNTPYLSNGSTTYLCDGYTQYVGAWVDYDSFWCYPIKIDLVENATQNIIKSETYHTASSSYEIFKAYKYQYKRPSTIRLTDATGYVYNLTRNSNFAPNCNFYSITYGCNTFTATLRTSLGSFLSCFPVEIDVYKKNDAGAFVFVEKQTLTNNSKLVEYPYGTYRLDATFENIDVNTGEKYTQSDIQTVASPRPTSFSVSGVTQSYQNIDLSNENYGYLSIYSSTIFPVGTRFTVVAAPAGYRHIGRTITSTSSSNYFYFGNSNTTSNSTAIHMPEGDYTINISDDCGTNLTTTTNLITGYDAKSVKYKVEEDGCNGALIKLDGTGYVKLRGISTPGYTNFKIISGPSGGFETSLKTYSQSLKINADGRYIIGTVINSTYPDYYIRRDTIDFVKSKPTLKTTSTSAYVCTGATSDVGYIIFTGQGGKAPYTYQLLDKDKNPIVGQTATGTTDERVVFNYGGTGETYVVRITDVCGNSTTQEVTLADLKTQSITYSIPPTGDYCTDDELMLNCITLGQTTYLWEKKNSTGGYDFISNLQNPRISPVTVANSGIYRVTVTPEYCGVPIIGELTVKVFPPLVPGTVTANQEICVATRAAAMTATATGGKGLHLYQWQSSTDGNTFAPITGATSVTYTPPVFTSSGPHYYRLLTTDDCKTVMSPIITLNVKPCYIMVNPNLRSKAKK